MSGKYITLLSNYDVDLYNNSNVAFKNRLAYPIECGADTEVSLIEISFLHNFKIQTSADCSFKIFDFLYQNPDKKYGKWTTINISQEQINNPIDLCIVLNTYIYKNVDRLKHKKREIFSYGNNGRIWVSFQEDDYVTIIPKNSLLYILGVMDKVKTRAGIVLGKSKEKMHYMYNGVERTFTPECQKKAYTSVCPEADFFTHSPHIDLVSEFLVLSDIVAASNVASEMPNMLRVITVPPDSGKKRVTLNFGAAPIYINSLATSINEIEIKLQSFSHSPLKLEGYVRVILHVRPKQN